MAYSWSVSRTSPTLSARRWESSGGQATLAELPQQNNVIRPPEFNPYFQPHLRDHKVILVVGTGGTGSAMVAGLLDLAGATLGHWEGKGKPIKSHQTGKMNDRHFERFFNLVLNDLGATILRHPSVSDIERYAANNPRRAELQELLARFDSCPVWTVKDPNIGALLPVLLRAMLDRGYLQNKIHVVDTVRHPEFSKRSLIALDVGFEKLTDTELTNFLREDRQRLKINTENMNYSRAHYDSILDAPREEIAKLLSGLGLPSAPRGMLEGFVKQELRRNGAARTDDRSLDAVLQVYGSWGVLWSR